MAAPADHRNQPRVRNQAIIFPGNKNLDRSRRTLTYAVLPVVGCFAVRGRLAGAGAAHGFERLPKQRFNPQSFGCLGSGRLGGVDFFFVLSGFLVSGLLFREHNQFGRISYQTFFIRRGLKIYPAFYFLLAVSGGVTFCLTGRPGLRVLAVEALFVQNYFPCLWQHTWSLAVEEHFYLLLPLLLIFLCRLNAAQTGKFKSIPWICLGLAILCLALRLAVSIRKPFDFRTHLAYTHLRLDGLFFGVMLSYFHHYQPNFLAELLSRMRLLLIGGIVAVTPAFIFPLETTFFIYTCGVTLFYVGFGSILLTTLAGNLFGNWIFSGLAYAG